MEDKKQRNAGNSSRHKTCPQCKKIFVPKRKEQAFCSRDCVHQARRTIRPLCLVCGQMVSKGRSLYCSTDCRKKDKWITRRCRICFTQYNTYRNRPNLYCSKECSNKAQSLRQLGANSHFWQGEKTKKNDKVRNHKLYQEWRKSVFERDNYTCQSCLRHASELRGQKLAAHHIVPFSKNKKTALKLSNGITLCWQCHQDYHDMVRLGLFEKTEDKLKEKALLYFKTEPGVCFYKIHGGAFQESGLPDLVGTVAGRFVAIELKQPPMFATPLQQAQIQRIKKAGGASFVCRSLDEVKRVIKIVKEAEE